MKKPTRNNANTNANASVDNNSAQKNAVLRRIAELDEKLRSKPNRIPAFIARYFKMVDEREILIASLNDLH